jgi:hypothetical protein
MAILALVLFTLNSPLATASASLSVLPSKPRSGAPFKTPAELSTPETPAILQPAPTEPVNLVAAENGEHIVSATDALDQYPTSNLLDGCKINYCEWWTHPSPIFPQVIVFGFAHDQVKTINQVVLNPWTSD